MRRFVGLDVHLRSTTIAVVAANGKRIKTFVVETNGQALVEAIRLIPGELHICLEEGTQSAWLVELLRPFAEEVVVSLPDRIRGAKSDRRDAWKLAEELRTDAVRVSVYKAPAHLAALQCAVRGDLMTAQDLVRVRNRLKAVFRSRGIPTDASVYNPDLRPKWIAQLPRAQQQLAQLLGRELDILEPLREQAQQWLFAEAKTHPIVKILSTAPGLGRTRTAQVVAVVATPHRFRTRRQFWSYCGLGVITRSSADWRHRNGAWAHAPMQQTRGLNRRRNALLKAVFKGAATTVIRQLPEDPLHAHYLRMLDSGIKPPLAKLTLARRISATVLSMWKHEEVYDPKRHAVVTD